MSYQVLARKWRPRIFRDMVGQEHVLQALVNALDRDRLHHAYLFTGTRGVGKTTIARILARCLNCETGVSSEPCGQCTACREIDEGRFVDLFEIDAASNTGVDDVREIIENAQYAPVRGRYKVYLVDEVHMLSKSAFNALLKTLEEPPPHVKFLLATTDPQKLPATVLSRCLQFNLKNLTPERIAGHLRHVLAQEVIEYDEPAVLNIAQAARGSMRDALSLTDQAIAYGGGRVIGDDVAAMLGTVDRGSVLQLLSDLVAGDAGAVFAQLDHLAEHGADFPGVLDELLSLLHALAVRQLLPERAGGNLYDAERLAQLAQRLPAEEIQLYYQLALNGRRDLPFVPEPRAGLDMALLRMLAFKPLAVPDWVSEPGASVSAGSMDAPAREVAGPAKKSPVDTGTAAATVTLPVFAPSAAPAAASSPLEARGMDSPDPMDERCEPTTQPGASATARNPLPALDVAGWPVGFASIPLRGIVRNIAANCQLVAVDGDVLQLVLDERHGSLYNESYRERLQESLRTLYGRELVCDVSVGAVSGETPAVYAARRREERRQQAVASLQADHNVRLLVEKFGGVLEAESVQLLNAGEGNGQTRDG